MKRLALALLGLCGCPSPAPPPASHEQPTAPTSDPNTPRRTSSTTRAVPGADGVVPDAITYTEHVAPLIYDRCAGCHRPGQVAPFSLLDEAEIRDHAEQIVEVTRSRFMPPWKPLAGHGEFVGDRSLTPAQIEIFAGWVAAGLPRGPASALPPPPKFVEGWPLGEPDLIVALPDAYTLDAEGLDRYRNFVIAAPLERKVWVRAWALEPGNARVVHHAILSIDRTGWARTQDAADPGLGFDAMDLAGAQSPDGAYLVWVPGSESEARGMMWSLGPGTDLIVQLHLQPSGKPETVQPRIGLYLSDRPPPRTGLTLRVGDNPIDIPPGEASYALHDTLELAADATFVSVFPHAHYLARSVEIEATLPSGEQRWLLRIADWDFAWQDQYRFRTPLELPAGTRIDLRIHYDNSADNPRNPSSPPRRVVSGPASTDEMGNATFEVLPHDQAGLLALRESKYRRELRFGSSATRHYNLANVLRERGKLDEAEAEYRAALVDEPEHVWSLHNLSMLLQREGHFDEAIAIAQRELAVTRTPATLNNLGNALRGAGRNDEAIVVFREALAIDPSFELARNNLQALGVE